MRKPINLAAFCGQNDIATFIKHLSHRGNIYHTMHSLLSPFDGRQHTHNRNPWKRLSYCNIHIHLHAEISLKYLQKYPQHFSVLYLCIYVNDCMVRLKYIICFYHCKRNKYKRNSPKKKKNCQHWKYKKWKQKWCICINKMRLKA